MANPFRWYVRALERDEQRRDPRPERRLAGGVIALLGGFGFLVFAFGGTLPLLIPGVIFILVGLLGFWRSRRDKVRRGG